MRYEKILLITSFLADTINRYLQFEPKDETECLGEDRAEPPRTTSRNHLTPFSLNSQEGRTPTAIDDERSPKRKEAAPLKDEELI